jgi:hypothetical protein
VKLSKKTTRQPSFRSKAMYTTLSGGLAARQGSKAAAEFQKILDHRGVVLNQPIGALAHLGSVALMCCRPTSPGPKRPIRISLRYGMTRTRMFLSCRRRKRSTRSCSRKRAPHQTLDFIAYSARKVTLSITLTSILTSYQGLALIEKSLLPYISCSVRLVRNSYLTGLWKGYRSLGQNNSGSPAAVRSALGSSAEM